MEFSILTRGNGRMVCLHTFWGKEWYLCFVCKNLFFVMFASFLCDRLGMDTEHGSIADSLLQCLLI
jgi:hypothetical protein